MCVDCGIPFAFALVTIVTLVFQKSDRYSLVMVTSNDVTVTTSNEVTIVCPAMLLAHLQRVIIVKERPWGGGGSQLLYW